MIEIDKIREFLLVHDYIPIVKQIDKNKCEVSYPLPLRGRKCLDTFYEVNWDSSCINVATTEGTESWYSPSYAVRLMIACDIMRQLEKLSISEQAVYYYNKDEKITDGIASIISEPSSDSDKNKEGFLHGLLLEAVRDKFTSNYGEVAEAHGVYTGYRLLKGFF